MARRISASQAHLPAGGGAFTLDRVTVGVFLTDQPGHRLSLGGTRAEATPPLAQDGWILPAGSDGMCRFDAPLDVVTVSLDSAMLAEVGLDDAGAVAPQIGGLDPLVFQMP